MCWDIWNVDCVDPLPVMTFLSKSGSSLNVVNNSGAMSLLKFCNFGTIFAVARFMPEISVKIACHEPNDMPTSSASSLIVIRRLFKIIFFTALMFSSVVNVLGRPRQATSLTWLDTCAFNFIFYTKVNTVPLIHFCE